MGPLLFSLSPEIHVSAVPLIVTQCYWLSNFDGAAFAYSPHVFQTVNPTFRDIRWSSTSFQMLTLDESAFALFSPCSWIDVSGVPLTITQSYYLHKVTSTLRSWRQWFPGFSCCPSECSLYGAGLPLEVTSGHPISFFSGGPLTLTRTKLYQHSPHLWSHCV